MQSSTPGYPLWSSSIVARLVGLRRSLVRYLSPGTPTSVTVGSTPMTYGVSGTPCLTSAYPGTRMTQPRSAGDNLPHRRFRTAPHTSPGPHRLAVLAAQFHLVEHAPRESCGRGRPLYVFPRVLIPPHPPQPVVRALAHLQRHGTVPTGTQHTHDARKNRRQIAEIVQHIRRHDQIESLCRLLEKPDDLRLLQLVVHAAPPRECQHCRRQIDAGLPPGERPKLRSSQSRPATQIEDVEVFRIVPECLAHGLAQQRRPAVLQIHHLSTIVNARKLIEHLLDIRSRRNRGR